MCAEINPTDMWIRQESIKIIANILRRDEFFSENEVICLGASYGLERGFYNRSIDLEEKNKVASWIMPTFIPTYKLSRQSLCEKLEHLYTHKLFADFMKEPANWSTLANKPIYELLPKVFEKQITTIMIRAPIVIKVKYCDQACNNCGKFTVIPESQQTRSADESSTPSLFCDSCNYRETRSS